MIEDTCKIPTGNKEFVGIGQEDSYTSILLKTALETLDDAVWEAQKDVFIDGEGSKSLLLSGETVMMHEENLTGKPQPKAIRDKWLEQGYWMQS